MNKVMNKTIADFPAYRIIEPTADPSHGMHVFKSGDTFAIDSGKGFWRIYTLGSVSSYAISYNECPISAVSKAVENDHELWWANQNASVLSSTPSAQETHVGLNLNDKVVFEGRVFTILPAPNQNIRLEDHGTLDHVESHQPLYTITLSHGPNVDIMSHEMSPKGYWQAPLENGAPQTHPIRSLEEARDLAMAYRNRNRLGGGNWRGGQIRDADGKQVARVAYNGRVFSYPDEEPVTSLEALTTLSGQPSVQPEGLDHDQIRKPEEDGLNFKGNASSTGPGMG